MIKKLLQKLRKPVEADGNTTVVFLLALPYDDPLNNRTKRIALQMARAGVNTLILPTGTNQTEPIHNPKPELLHLKILKPGTDARPYMTGRTVFWFDNPDSIPTCKLAHPNLVVFDEYGPGGGEAARFADLTFSAYPFEVNYIEPSPKGIQKALNFIHSMPNRKPPRT